MSCQRCLLVYCFQLSAVLALVSDAFGADAFDRLRLSKLRTTRAALEALRDQRQEVERPHGEFRDFRAQIHVHSYLSHDSVAPLEEIIQAAKQCNAQILLFTDHPSEEYDSFLDGHQGFHDGVLLIPGAEKEGFLLLPMRSFQKISHEDDSAIVGEDTVVASRTYEKPQELADLILKDGGLVFLSHLEERMDWEIGGITGTEIYNTHADVIGEKQFLQGLKNPAMLMSLLPAIQQFPQESFGAILDYPEDYLSRWDQLCQTAPHTGVAANDSHHNQVIRAIVTKDGQLAIEDALGKQVAKVDPEKVALIKPLVANRKPGDILLELDLDPYERSFRHVSTHLLMRELTREDVWQALKAGRAYVSFEWLADPIGFYFEAHRGNQRWQMGSEINLDIGDRPPTESNSSQSLAVSAGTPLPAIFKLIHNGKVIREDRGRNFNANITQPGVYRLEAWLLVADELKPWILSNPFYVKER